MYYRWRGTQAIRPGITPLRINRLSSSAASPVAAVEFRHPMLNPGQTIGPYTVIGPLGAGGMGEVYRARDPRLDRDVAIKVLPAAFSADVARVARFEHEAKAIAALSHPNVLAIYDTGWAETGEAARHLYVITELLEGETLRERLAAGALPLRRAVDIATQTARGLAAAHDKGIVHRDIKPENVFVTAAGHVKILDFGLARSISAADPGSASVTKPGMTDAGSILGTVGYMAPEQVRGRPADARADLFALGAVLYEMLTGQQAFRRDTAADTMTAILKEEPPELAALRGDVPPALERIVHHCLEKNTNERFQSARDVAFALESLSGSSITATTAALAAPVRSRAGWERLAWAVVCAALAGSLVWMQLRRPAVPTTFTAPHRATLLLPDGVSLTAEGSPGAKLAVSPDGSQVAFVGVTERGPMLWLHSMDETMARSIEGSEGASAPFWSPDSRILAFHRDDTILTLDVHGAGRVSEFGHGGGTAAWVRSRSGDVVLTATSRPEGIGIRTLSPRSRVAGDLLIAKPSEVFAFPASLADGRRFLFTYGDLEDLPTIGVYVGTLGTSEKTRVLALDPDNDNINSQYASGYLLTAHNQSILARSFDLETLNVATDAVEVAAPVFGLGRRGAAFSVSQNGVLVYQSASRNDRYRLVVHDRTGQPLRTLSDDAGYSNLELSPDGSQLALSVPDAATRNRDVWVIDIVRGVRTRVTFDPSDERSVVWSLDGKSLVYTSKGLDLYTKPLGVGTENVLLKDGLSKDPRGWSPDGEFFVYRVTGNAGRNDLWIKPRDPAKKPYAFLATPFDENYATFSPDGRWIAYVSNESGRPEVYATSFPSGAGKWRISTSGGMFPRWRRDNTEIVYLAPDNKLMSAAVDASGRSLQVSTAAPLFQTRAAPGPGSPFDMTADAQRFIVNTELASATPPSLIVVYNWPALIQKK